MNETNLREYAVSYKRKKYIQNTRFTRIRKIRAGMDTNTAAPKINKEADRIRIDCAVYHTDFRAQIYNVYCQYVSVVFTNTGRCTTGVSVVHHRRSCFGAYAHRPLLVQARGSIPRLGILRFRLCLV
jgi:hypothetical protein